MKELIEIQAELNAPKSAWNDFSKFYYRTTESILAALKPLLKKLNCSLVLSDELILIGDRFYVKSTVTLSSDDTKEAVSATGYARESESKKGLDSMQITGAASSYARKYALNGLFAIDDTKDADDPSIPKEEDKKPPNHAENKKPGPPKQTENKKDKPWLNPDGDKWQAAVEALANKKVDVPTIEKNYRISGENKKKLLEESAALLIKNKK